ncbi:MAG: GNAT family N-acetyltransferase [Calditrichaeota bacterium]|nr:GNAT family N-acetyltransferase [Calditrichota bacterium]MCB0267723.1 GNAT family N-acetyltransferase [Calditrichota bacterium]MCB0285017.1 GNAT family N-acetyltransferase [Calditrichota bacterium]MCB0299532.1 GNAT family N-acetyltransferase [Calditrichota bacterium]
MTIMKTSSEQKTPVILFELLDKKHRRNNFDCGNEALNQFIKSFALQNQKKQVSNTFVAFYPDAPNTILGYYSVSSGSLKYDDLPEEIQKKLPKYPIPMILMGRLAVDVSTQGQGIGQKLLMDAFRRAFFAAKEIAAAAVVVNAKDEKAKAFYQKYGFRELTNDPLTLFITMKEISMIIQ